MNFETRDNSDEYVFKECKVYGKKFTFNFNDIFLDCGANIGGFPFLYSNKVKKIICYEMDKSNYKMACKNTYHLNNVIVINKGIIGFKEKERVYFKHVKYNSSHSFFLRKHDFPVKVKCDNIVDVIKKYSCNKIKLDIEGTEYECLEAIKFIKNIDEIVFEAHLKFGLTDKFKPIIAMLSKNYSVLYNKPFNGTTIVICKRRKD